MTQAAAPRQNLRYLLLSNFALALAVRAVTTVVALFTIPWLIDALGVTLFGVYAVIVSVTGFAAFVDSGLAVHVRTLVAESTARDDPVAAQRAVGAGVTLLLLVAGFLLTAFSASLFLLPWPSWLGAEAAAVQEPVLLALFAYIALYALSLPLLPALRALEGLQRTPYVTALTIVPSALLFVGVFLLKDQHLGLLPFVAVAGIGPVIVGILGVVRLARVSRALLPQRHSLNLSQAKSLVHGTWPMVVVSVALSLSYTLDPFVIASVLGPRSVVEYTLANKMSQIANLTFVASAPILWTHFTRARARGQRGQRRLLNRLIAAYSVLAVLGGIMLIWLGPTLTSLWSGGAVHSPRGLFTAFAVWGVALASHLPAAMLQTDSRSVRIQAGTTSVMAVVNVVLSLVLVHYVGVAGPVWASAAALAVCHAGPMLWRAQRVAGAE